MLLVNVNYLAVLVCGIINMVLGFLWYGPLFGKPWVKMMGFDVNDKKKKQEMQKKAGPAYLVMFLCSLLSAFILSNFIGYAGVNTLAAGAVIGLLAWLGFVVQATLSNAMFGGKNIKLWMIESGYYLVSLLIFGAVLAVWK